MAKLADRLTDRLEEAGGGALVREPMGWLLGRGMVHRQACPDPRCDDGIRLDTGSNCPRCEDVVQVRRAWRSQITAEVDERMPGAALAGRRAAIEGGLRRRAVIEAEDAAIRHAKAERRQAACAAAEARVQTEHKFAAVAEALLQAEPCADCGAQHSSGLCEACGYRRETRRLAAEAGLIAAVWSADLRDADDVQAVAADVRASLERDAAAAQERFLQLMDPAEIEADQQRVDTCLAFNALQAVQAALPEYRRAALAMLARTPEAEAEARRAYATEQGRRQHRRYPDRPVAVTAAEQAADTARERTAQHLQFSTPSRTTRVGGGGVQHDVLRAFRFALDPTAAQTAVLVRHAGAARWAFNHALGMKAAAHKEWRRQVQELTGQGMSEAEARKKVRVSVPTKPTIQRHLNQIKGDSRTGGLPEGVHGPARPSPWWHEVNTHAFQSAFIDADRAWTNWLGSFRGARAGTS
ncbi:helix-turn-helix domain-containing protein (plasmid) [Streptomyces sp. NBC_01136]|uniref:helix-turn-helix domain-containing protein n=1 Tax=unclassified Streptomyces TaxID=2593676 RepID=UPI002F918579|nr:helix-turn-helix domain-containing protein [Streptomyces sp. NBC_01136]